MNTPLQNEGMTICNLHQRPEFTATVAERIWNAWWRENGVSLADVEKRVRESLLAQAVPLCLVAHAQGRFIGTVSLIENDLDERPQYGPWIAALWVDESERGNGAGSRLVAEAVQAAFEQGRDTVYLCATQENAGFYARMGWKTVETGVGDLTIFSLDRQI